MRRASSWYFLDPALAADQQLVEAVTASCTKLASG